MYMLFAGNTYYPAGGMNDFRGFFPTLDEARKAAVSSIDGEDEDEDCPRYYDWYQIVHAQPNHVFVILEKGRVHRGHLMRAIVYHPLDRRS